MFLLKSLVQMLSKLGFCLKHFANIVKLILAAVNINGLTNKSKHNHGKNCWFRCLSLGKSKTLDILNTHKANGIFPIEPIFAIS